MPLDLIQFVRGMEEQEARPRTIAEWQMNMAMKQAQMDDYKRRAEQEQTMKAMEMQMKREQMADQKEYRQGLLAAKTGKSGAGTGSKKMSILSNDKLNGVAQMFDYATGEVKTVKYD